MWPSFGWVEDTHGVSLRMMASAIVLCT